jgi:hypothetical protein
MTQPEAKDFIGRLFEHLSQEDMGCIDKVATERLNTGIYTTQLVLKCHPCHAWRVSEAVHAALQSKTGLQYPDWALSANTETVRERRPTKAAGGHTKSILIRSKTGEMRLRLPCVDGVREGWSSAGAGGHAVRESSEALPGITAGSSEVLNRLRSDS